MQQMIYGSNGQRKYLTSAERRSFLSAAANFERETLTLCWVISATGCRISEALSLTANSIDRHDRMIVIECLKKRRRGIYRSIPVPAALIDLLTEVHDLRDHIGQGKDAPRLWSFSRVTAYRRIRKVMESANLNGQHAMPKGLRHCFGVSAIQSQVPLNLVQRWLGHADMRTTAIYAGAMGPEERNIARRMWRNNAMKLPDYSAIAAK
ncbi:MULTISPECIES: site-specific integrase [unclassified Novosphingobium]|uniref:tyrosine-type recombinase/integrase n=1 Tax=unclassified Novosphingobium TaxID=2644732 RepID=UPI0017D55174|nr:MULTISPECIES: site-specific integrase [unclassified Novosphingobium]NMN03854.1 integrase [Novosphingobium sp. SG919]NMN86156.1 integrase [Novosphingobium sp. SG916]